MGEIFCLMNGRSRVDTERSRMGDPGNHTRTNPEEKQGDSEEKQGDPDRNRNIWEDSGRCFTEDIFCPENF
jgi:hypothetical protein